MEETVPSRPPVSVVVPFRGDAREAQELLDALGRLRLGDGDELMVVDNGPRATVPADRAAVRVVRAADKPSSYYSRNVGAAAAANAWLLFLDADCRPPAALLDVYLADPPAPRCGILAGEVVSAREQTTLPARHARARDHLGVEAHLSKGPHPAGVTANLMVRRETWEALGGFHEVRSGADLEFCWRAHDLGWELSYRPQAAVEHLHSEHLDQMLRKARRYGPGQVWVNRRYPGAAPPPALARELVRAVGGVLVWGLTARFERAAFKVLDGLWMSAYTWGYYTGDNRPSGSDGEAASAGYGERPLVFVGDGCPDQARGPALDQLREASAGRALTVLSAARPQRIDRRATSELDVHYLEDEPPVRRLGALTWLAGRRPIRLLRDLAEGRREGRSAGTRSLAALAPAVRRLAGRRGIEVCADPSPEAASVARRLSRLLGGKLTADS